jgi:uncharacterized protein YbjT (DUF2867 family)
MARTQRPTLVVGATGQLGSRIVRRLVEFGRPVRVFVRPQSGHAPCRNAVSRRYSATSPMRPRSTPPAS